MTVTADITDYLAGQSAGRCGPCRHGLPSLATALRGVAEGAGAVGRVEELAGIVVGRGACAHPDGTSRLVRSLLAAFPRRGRDPCPRWLHRGRQGRGVNHELRVDWPACTGRGLCHEVLPELIDLDEWGYPVVLGPVPTSCCGKPAKQPESVRVSRSAWSPPPPADLALLVVVKPLTCHFWPL